MAGSLSNLANNLAESIHKIKCKYEQDKRTCETCEIWNKNCKCFLEYINLKMIQYNTDVVTITIKENLMKT